MQAEGTHNGRGWRFLRPTISLRTALLVVLPLLAIACAKLSALVRHEALIARLESKQCVVVTLRPDWATWLPHGEVANQAIGTLHSRAFLSTDAKHRQWFDHVVEMHSHAPLTDDDLAALAAFPHLHRLDVGESGITDASARRLAQLKSLEILALRGNPVTDPTAVYLVDRLPKLKTFDLRNTLVSGPCALRIRHSHPAVEVLCK
jgi:hypothetical protein